MSRKHAKTRGKWMLVLGAALMLCALVCLFQVENRLQYVAVSPTETQDGGQLKALIQGTKEARVAIGDAVSAMALSAQIDDAPLTASSGETGSAAVTAAGVGYFEVSPQYLTAGRLMNQEELTDGADVIVLDERLAFSLFRGADPLLGKVTVADREMQVIGVVRHAYSVGEAALFRAFVPIQTLADHAVQTQTFQLTGCSAAGGSAAALFESTARTALQTGGNFYDLSKEKMRATIMPRILLIIAAGYVLLFLIRRVSARLAEKIREYQALSQHAYLRDRAWEIARWAALFVGVYAVIGAGIAGVAVFAAKPLYVFTEWIPEVIVEWSSIKSVLLTLTQTAAASIRVSTPEMAVIRFFAAMMRWGIAVFLMGGLLAAFSLWKRQKAQAD